MYWRTNRAYPWLAFHRNYLFLGKLLRILSIYLRKQHFLRGIRPYVCWKKRSSVGLLASLRQFERFVPDVLHNVCYLSCYSTSPLLPWKAKKDTDRWIRYDFRRSSHNFNVSFVLILGYELSVVCSDGVPHKKEGLDYGNAPDIFPFGPTTLPYSCLDMSSSIHEAE